MSFLTNFLLGLGLAMDAFAVSMSSGTTVRPFKISDALKLAVFFGGFQALMPVLGWAGKCGKWLCSDYALDCIRAPGFHRGKMIYEALRRPGRKSKFLNYSMLFLLAVATSIDALAVGISFAFLGRPFSSP